jgi:hypothetical protein
MFPVNLTDASTQAGETLTHRVHVRYTQPDSGDWERAAPVFGQVSADDRDLSDLWADDPRMRIEIEADARDPRQSLGRRRRPDGHARRLRDDAAAQDCRGSLS